MELSAEVDAGQFILKVPEEYKLNLTTEIEWHEVFGKFKENLDFKTDELEYKRTGSEPGLIIIFNVNEKTRPRPGSSKDVEDIITCLSRLGFNINPKFIFNNLSKKAMFENVVKILEGDISEVNSVLVFVLTHGGPSNQLFTSTDTFMADDLFIQFAKSPLLKGKPKLFVIQACKGVEPTRYLSTPEDTTLVPISTFSSGNIYSDMVIMYSTMEGKFAYRDPQSGSWLIQEICRNFTAYGRRDDVLTILSRVSKCVCRNYYTGGKDIAKQVPVVVSTLSKKFYLNNNKDRHLLLTLLDKQNVVLDTIRSISNIVNSVFGITEKNNE